MCSVFALKFNNFSLRQWSEWFCLFYFLDGNCTHATKVSFPKVVFELNSTRKPLQMPKRHLTLARGEFSVCVMQQKILAGWQSSRSPGHIQRQDSGDGCIWWRSRSMHTSPGSVIFKSNLSLSSFNAILFIREEWERKRESARMIWIFNFHVLLSCNLSQKQAERVR